MRLLLPLACLACARAQQPAAPPPILLVSLDTLRADRLGCYGNPDGLTPSLDRFASEAVLFEHAYSQTTTTAPSHASLFTSRYPSEQEAADRKPAFGEMKTLAEVFGVYGWPTAGVVAGGDLAPEMGVGRGFDAWESPLDFASLWHTVPIALAWLDARDGVAPWFLFVHGYDAHARYLKPSPFGYAIADATATGPGQEAVRSSTDRLVDGWLHADASALPRFSGTEARPRSPEARARLLEAARAHGDRLQPVSDADVELVRDVYDGAVAYGDIQFGLLMAGLHDRGILDRAVVIVLADHGEQLGEDGVFNHCCGVDDTETHVPLLVRLPRGEGGGRRIAGLVELVDVAPTVLELAGLTPPAGMRGVSLVPALRGEPFEGRAVAWTQGGMSMRMVTGRTLTGRLTYAGAPASSPLAPEFIETAALPGPSFVATPGLDASSQATIRTEMAAWLRTLSPAPREEHAPLPEALRRSLQEHGYFEVAP